MIRTPWSDAGFAWLLPPTSRARAGVASALGLALALGSAGCKKDGTDGKAAPAAPPAVTKVEPDGVRHIAITANADGYTPGRIPGKPGEKLVLVFTRTLDASCIEELKAPNGTIVKLPLNQPVDVEVTVPKSGEVEFACGMNMFHGTVVAQPAT